MVDETRKLEKVAELRLSRDDHGWRLIVELADGRPGRVVRLTEGDE